MDSVTHFTKFVDFSHFGITDSSQFKFIYRNFFLKHFIEGKIARRIDVTRRRDRRRKQLLDGLKEEGILEIERRSTSSNFV